MTQIQADQLDDLFLLLKLFPDRILYNNKYFSFFQQTKIRPYTVKKTKRHSVLLFQANNPPFIISSSNH